MTNLKQLFISKKYLFIIYFLIMTLTFYTNLFGVLNKTFSIFRKGTETLIIGKIIVSENSGLFYKSGFTGIYGDYLNQKNDIHKIYINKTLMNEKEFVPYQSQIGGQGMFYAVLNTALLFSNKTKLEIFYLITSILTAIGFTFFLVWTYKQFGFLSSLSTLIGILLSYWIILFSKNLWWSLWSFYVPFLFLLYYLDNKKLDQIKPKSLILYSAVFVFIKCLFTGFDYITPALIMLTVPLVYYSILNSWDCKTYLKLVFQASFGALIGVFTSIIILLFQLYHLKTNGLSYLTSKLIERTYSTVATSSIRMNKSYTCSIWEVINKYLVGPAFKFRFHNDFYSVSFFQVIILFLLVSIGFIVFQNKLFFFNTNKKKYTALIVTLWFSITAPLSWFVIFKSHSYIHTHLTFIVWYMPFMLFGFVLIGFVIDTVLNKNSHKKLIL